MIKNILQNRIFVISAASSAVCFLVITLFLFFREQELTESLKQLEFGIASLKDENKALLEENSAVREQLNKRIATEKEFSELKNENKSLRFEIEDAKKARQDMLAAKAELENKVKMQEEQLTNLTLDLDSHLSEIVKLTTEISHLKAITESRSLLKSQRKKKPDTTVNPDNFLAE